MTSIAVSNQVKGLKVTKNTEIQPKGKYMVRDQDVSFKQSKAINAKQQKSLYTALGLVISLLMVIAAFEWKSYEQQELLNLGTLDAQFEEILDIPLTQQEPPPPVQEMVPPEIIEVPDEEQIEEAPEEEETEEIFDIVEEQASPVGGMNTFFTYFASNLKYPIPAKQRGRPVNSRVTLPLIFQLT